MVICEILVVHRAISIIGIESHDIGIGFPYGVQILVLSKTIHNLRLVGVLSHLCRIIFVPSQEMVASPCERIWFQYEHCASLRSLLFCCHRQSPAFLSINSDHLGRITRGSSHNVPLPYPIPIAIVNNFHIIVTFAICVFEPIEICYSILQCASNPSRPL